VDGLPYSTTLLRAEEGLVVHVVDDQSEALVVAFFRGIVGEGRGGEPA
jgi:hypothetical protein